MVLKATVGLTKLTAQQLITADYNADGKVNTGNTVSILKHCVSTHSTTSIEDFAQ